MAKSNSEVAARRREHWQDLLGGWQASGLSQARFCRRHGIAVWKLAWWRKRLSRESGGQAERSARQRGRFMQVHVAGSIGTSPAMMELAMSNGRLLRFTADADAAKLAGIVAALEAIAPVPAEGSTC